jgi:4-hydroxy-2-oxoheptanedioate aldolase
LRNSKTLARLRAQEPVRMCALGHFIPAYIHHAANFGFDCIWLDLEHRAMTDREVQSLLTHFHLADIDCMLRPATLEKTRLYRYLEDGATGLMMPHVSTPEKAQQLVNAVKFPPVGDRGLDGAGLDSDFLLSSVPDHVDHTLAESFLVVQIETPEAVANIEQIAAVEGVDGLFVGPGDLGLRINRLGADFTLEEAIDRVAQVAAAAGKAWGLPASSVEQIEMRREQGAQLLPYGGDFGACMEMLRKHGEQLATTYGEGNA